MNCRWKDKLGVIIEIRNYEEIELGWVERLENASVLYVFSSTVGTARDF
jgi:hypothetical protein